MIFLDSSYLIGLIIDNDQHHTKAIELKPYLKNEKKTHQQYRFSRNFK
jgi:predicted nucleic acid-binding protein